MTHLICLDSNLGLLDQSAGKDLGKLDLLCISGRNIKNLYNYFGESFDNTEDATPYIIVIPVLRFYPFIFCGGGRVSGVDRKTC